MKVYIYSLNDPDSLQIRYIGKTTNLKKRLSSHIQEAKRSNGRRYVLNWIKNLLNNSKRPVITVIEECTEGDWQERERYWIYFYKKTIPNLCNNADGGLGGSGVKNYTQKELDKRRITASNTFSKFPTELNISIWSDMQILTKKEVFNKYPEMTRNIYFQVINGYCWNNITGLPKKKSSKIDYKRSKNSGVKLTDLEIKQIKFSELTHNELAQCYKVSQATIWRIKTKW